MAPVNPRSLLPLASLAEIVTVGAMATLIAALLAFCTKASAVAVTSMVLLPLPELISCAVAS